MTKNIFTPAPKRVLLRHSLLVASLLSLSACFHNSGTVRLPSENFNSRISVIVLHHTATNFEDAVNILTHASSNSVSSHYLVPEPDDATYTDDKLKVFELVPESQRAWHAGRSYWAGKQGLNDQSIGIEIVNKVHCVPYDPLPLLYAENTAHQEMGLPVKTDSPVKTDMPLEESLPVELGLPIETSSHEKPEATAPAAEAAPPEYPKDLCFYPDFAESQISVLIELLQDIHERYPDLDPTNIVGHSDIAPDRKIDPGPRFPWQRLYQLGYGAWYDDDTVTRYWKKFIAAPLPLITVQKALHAYGYEIEETGVLDEQTRNVLRAFQMHFRPSAVTSKPTVESTAILYALIEKYRPEALESLNGSVK
ncbi:hypothetical protein CRD36_10360 [Paremcibacter congregatus]|uniref:N-acetylmuramoyl-L-alanine amidase n=1 Tax=Paremcibacter congregatus TaxID=2043170 RepID=A0A2G4YQT3_9PROT|nr:hypothetical protein CRD36_10360 [Paremcibacter congregatus]